MKALLIAVNFRTGERAGGVCGYCNGQKKRDPGLVCHGWQNMEAGLELRLITDDRDVSQYEGVEGLTVLLDEAAINAAIDQHFTKPDEYSIKSDVLVAESIRAKSIDISDLTPDMGDQAIAKALYERGCLGIKRRSGTPVKARDALGGAVATGRKA